MELVISHSIPKDMRYCLKFKIRIDEKFDCIKCKWNLPITFDFKVNCVYPIQLIWNKDLKIVEEGELE
jgi:hypothetical protein